MLTKIINKLLGRTNPPQQRNLHFDEAAEAPDERDQKLLKEWANDPRTQYALRVIERSRPAPVGDIKRLHELEGWDRHRTAILALGQVPQTQLTETYAFTTND